MTDSNIHFLENDDATRSHYDFAINKAKDAILEGFVETDQPYSGTDPATVIDRVGAVECFPEQGQGIQDALNTLTETIFPDAIRVHNPACMAHLHCPPIIPSVVAELVAASMNQGHASWDLGPSVDALEESFIAEFGELYGLPSTADGVFTVGGTQANLTAMLIARDWYADQILDVDVQASGFASELANLRIICSEEANFTIKQAAAYLGLGETAVVSVPTDNQYRMDVAALERILTELEADNKHPFFVVGTPGTTDFGSIDPLSKIGDVLAARDRESWFHVDAAYGGALILSDSHADKLAGIEQADSITTDFHKFLFQPMSCSMFLLRDTELYRYLTWHTKHLTPADDDMTHRLSKSIQTSRRCDVLKPFLTFRALGTDTVGEMIDATLEVVEYAAEVIAADPDFELLHDPELSTLVFRYCPTKIPDNQDSVEWTSAVNEAIRDRALQSGEVLIAQTQAGGVSCLRITLLNPTIVPSDIDNLVETLRRFGTQVERELLEQ